MTFAEIQADCLWKMDESTYSPQDITKTILKSIINQAIQDMVEHLYIEKSATLTFTLGVASLPSDFYAPISLYVDDKEMEQIYSYEERIDDTEEPAYYLITSEELEIFGKDTTDTGAFIYYARPATLSADGDIPVEIPIRFHDKIFIYVKAQMMMRRGIHDEYARLMNNWEQLKMEVENHVGRRNDNARHTIDSVWRGRTYDEDFDTEE